jgi:hypothetical protein
MANYAPVPDTYKGKKTATMSRAEYEKMLKELGYDKPSKEKHGYMGEEPDTAKPTKKMAKGGMSSCKPKKLSSGGDAGKSGDSGKSSSGSGLKKPSVDLFGGKLEPASLPFGAKGVRWTKQFAKGGDVKGFKPCASCPSPAKCKAAGKCLMAGKKKMAAGGMLIIPVKMEKTTPTKYAGAASKASKKPAVKVKKKVK